MQEIQKTERETEMKIKLEWSINDREKPYFQKYDEGEYEAQDKPRSYIVRYGSGNVRKILKKFTRLGKPRTVWRESYRGEANILHVIKFSLIS